VSCYLSIDQHKNDFTFSYKTHKQAYLRAIEASKHAKSLRVFFDWKDYLKFYQLGTYWPYTPSIHLLYGLRAALDLIFEEGLENVIARHIYLGKAWSIVLETQYVPST